MMKRTITMTNIIWTTVLLIPSSPSLFSSSSVFASGLLTCDQCHQIAHDVKEELEKFEYKKGTRKYIDACKNIFSIGAVTGAQVLCKVLSKDMDIQEACRRKLECNKYEATLLAYSLPPNPNQEPDNPPKGYFNYDPNSQYGPENWGSVDTSNHWLKEFGRRGWGPWRNHYDDNLTRNVCNGRKRTQSPKHLVGNYACEAHHEIRTECATDPLVDDDAFDKQILPHKLSIVARRRPCKGEEGVGLYSGFGRGNCTGVDRPPMVDYPKYSASGSSWSDMHHMDIKIPGEHTLEGEEPFDAEFQLFHAHLFHQRVSSIAIPVRATTKGFNQEFQWILDAFQEVYDRHYAECAATLTQRNLRQQHEQNHTRHATFFNPYSDALMPGMFFYRYDGSITEPPCKAITWWVMDQPAIISINQLQQLKILLFSHVDSNCQPTSVHNVNQSSVRPIQPLGEYRVIQHCPAGSFRSDISKGRPQARSCRIPENII